MPYTDFWQEVIDIVYDAINSELNTQEEIDDIISDQFSIFAGYTDNMDDIPNDYKQRPKEFDNPVNLLRYISEGGIPISAIWIWREVTADDYFYHTFIGPS